jgi:hypothetical protein
MPIKVFRIEPDFGYQTFFTSDPDGPESAVKEYDLGTGPMLSNWTPLPLFEDRPERAIGNFAHCWGGGFIVDRKASTVLERLLENVSELLPLENYKGNNYYLLNAFNCIDCLDEQKTKWRVGKIHGTRFAIDEYQFFSERLIDSTIFRIPRQIDLFTTTGHENADSEFKTVVERKKLTGLTFKEIWSDGSAQSIP